ncbi:hypothetical protein [Lunatibacter salilacus]|uniref:hypothetical protein n=1 Tax=Lunatibacter salilacus TaxID=2483804 RepID=UPI00131A87A1|nr:hypothetical protein [Lunatibacter salilacus]
MAKFGITQDEYPQIRIHLPMLTTIKKILGTEIILNEYEEYFQKAAPEPESGEINKLNELITLLFPALNAGHTPDIEAAAKKVVISV